MDIGRLFLERHSVLYDHYLAGLWQTVPEDLMRQRPDPRLNSVAWNLWHLARVEDAGLNRFVVDGSQVFDEGGWLQRLNVPWRHQGTGMTFDEVDDLNQRIDLQALHDYSSMVGARTQEVVKAIDPTSLDGIMDAQRLRVILFDEGLAAPQSAGLLDNYTGWSKGRCLIHFGLTHSFQHVGEIGVIASLLGLEF